VDRWHTISEFHGKKSRNICIRIRDTAKSEIPTEVKALKSQTRECIGVSAYRDSGVGKTSCSTSRVPKSR
jgi:hypothetical protein